MVNTAKLLNAGERVLVVGGTGFIGRHVVAGCLRSTQKVTILGFNEDGHPKCNNKAEFIEADLTNRGQLINVLKGRQFEYVLNFGGYIDHTPYLKGGRRVIDAHYTGLMNLVDALDKEHLKGFVQIGSSDEYGGSDAPQTESLRESPISPYSLAKVNASHFVQMISRYEKFPGVVLRFFLVYGPGQDSKRFLPQIIQACLKAEPFKTSEGKQLRDFCYIDDVVDAVIKAAVLPDAKGNVINIASGKPVKIREMIKTVVKIIGKGEPQWGAHPYRLGENMALYADTAKAKELLGWQADISLDEGLRRTIEYFKDVLKA